MSEATTCSAVVVASRLWHVCVLARRAMWPRHARFRRRIHDPGFLCDTERQVG